VFTHRLEWEPDTPEQEGFLRWFLDDALVLQVDAATLRQAGTGARIPAEPLYLVLNTAVSHSWGFPEPCDIAECAACYQCYDCTHPDCQCSLPEGETKT
jgi:hypothetical protein